MKRKRKKSNSKKEISFFKEYNFEITVFAMFVLGVFLLVEKIEISQTIFKFIKTMIFLFADLIKAFRDSIYDTLSWLELSDLVGVVLILFASYLIALRIRVRLLMLYPKIYECQYCDNKNKLKRIPKKLKHRIIHFALRLRVYYYQCDDCYKKQLIVITKKR